MRGIGVPAEMIAGMREGPLWPALEAAAHTLVYESFIPGSLPPERLAAIRTPTLVLGSEGSDDRLRTWVQGVAEALPNAAALPAGHLARGVPGPPRTGADGVLHRPVSLPAVRTAHGRWS